MKRYKTRKKIFHLNRWISEGKTITMSEREAQFMVLNGSLEEFTPQEKISSAKTKAEPKGK